MFKSNWEEIYAIRHRIGLAIVERFRDQGVGFSYAGHTVAPPPAPGA